VPMMVRGADRPKPREDGTASASSIRPDPCSASRAPAETPAMPPPVTTTSWVGVGWHGGGGGGKGGAVSQNVRRV
jgi:hypothetical protein